MASSLRRTFQGSIRYSPIYIAQMKQTFLIIMTIAGLFSCNNHRSKNEKLLNEIDNVSKSLENINEKVSKSTKTLYIQAEKKIADIEGLGKIKQMQSAVQDFYGFMSELEMNFIKDCGDDSCKMLPETSLDNLSLTNDFFLRKGNAAKLFHQMKKVQTILLLNVADSLSSKKISDWIIIPSFEVEGTEENKFIKGYFYFTPPVAATTILHKFENDVRVFENIILTD